MTLALKKYSLYFLILVYFSGAIGFVINPSFFNPFTPVTLVFTCFVFLIHQKIFDSKYLLSFFAVAVIGFVSEVIGVKTGFIFGNYYYGNALGYKLMGVPLVISLNWALLVNLGILIAAYFSENRIIISLISAALITSVDFLIEQVASKMDFWIFSGNIAGLHNYIGWFVISFLAALLLQKELVKGNKKIALTILCLQVFFFGLIYIVKLFNFT